MPELFDNIFHTDRPAPLDCSCALSCQQKYGVGSPVSQLSVVRLDTNRMTAHALQRTGVLVKWSTWLLIFLVASSLSSEADEVSETQSIAETQTVAETLTRVIVQFDDRQLSLAGRVIVEAQDGGLLFEERNGRIHTITPAMLLQRTSEELAFTRMDTRELSASLLETMGTEFSITTTDHYVICSNTSKEYTQFCGKLLDQVYAEFFKFFAGESRPFVKEPSAPLPVIVFSSSEQLKQFASRQHPDVSFDDTPGYYSVRDNQILIMDLSGESAQATASSIRRKLLGVPRQVSTVVHEAVHQLAFNSGLQVRMADNPVWLSEGLAMWFEPTSNRSALLWSRPGQVNPVHQPLFMSFVHQNRLSLPLQELLASDKPFQNADTLAVAYSESWAITAWMIRQQPEAMDKMLKALSERKPLQSVTPDQRITEFQQVFGKDLDEIERSMIPFIKRMRVPRD